MIMSLLRRAPAPLRGAARMRARVQAQKNSAFLMRAVWCHRGRERLCPATVGRAAAACAGTTARAARGKSSEWAFVLRATSAQWSKVCRARVGRVQQRQCILKIWRLTNPAV